jgi:carboxypeptidase family protein
MRTQRFVLAAAVLFVSDFAAAQTARSGEAPRSDPARSVTLSLTEYNRLVDLASRPQPPTATPPVGAVLASADLRVRVDRDSVHGVFGLAGDVLRSGITRVPLISGATIIDANADGRPVPLSIDGGAHTALLPGPGPFAVTLEWGAPLAFAPGRASFSIPVPPAGAARATIDVPGEQADIHLSAGIITRRTAAAGRTVVEAALRPGTPAEVWWSMRDSAPVAAAREVRMLADVFTLVTIGESDLRMAALVDVSVVQGEPRTIDVRVPGGYELAAVSGSVVDSSETRDGIVVLTVADPAVRRHQFLISLERTHSGGSFSIDTDFVALPGVQRDRGEIAVEGIGTLELNAAERSGMHRIDVRELNPALQSLARVPILAAFRYQRSAATQVGLAMNVQRFADAGVLAAVADRAVATTLVTSEGRALTEVVLQLRNRAQPFLKVTLPPGASIVSVEVAGEGAKPVVGADGTRVPLLRPGFRPSGVYSVSFVYLHAGTPFVRKGELTMSLPKMDIPVGIVEWETFVPDRYRVQVVGGNVIDRQVAALPEAKLAIAAARRGSGVGAGVGAGYGDVNPSAGPVEVRGGVAGGIVGGLASADSMHISPAPGALPGQIRGTAKDQSGTALPGATIVLQSGAFQKAAVAAGDGTFLISGVPSGTLTATARLAGFVTQTRSFDFDQQPRQVDFVLAPVAATETVTVSGTSERVAAPPPPPAQKAEPSQNVINLQRRATGVLPIRIDIPRAGTSHQFLKPLFVDQEGTVVLRYKRM